MNALGRQDASAYVHLLTTGVGQWPEAILIFKSLDKEQFCMLLVCRVTPLWTNGTTQKDIDSLQQRTSGMHTMHEKGP